MQHANENSDIQLEEAENKNRKGPRNITGKSKYSKGKTFRKGTYAGAAEQEC